jgi:hypothetical protein
MEDNQKAPTRLFGPISSRVEATSVIAGAARACYACASILIIVSLLGGLSGVAKAMPDAILYAGLGFWLQRQQSRVAAVLLFSLAAVTLILTIVNLFGGGLRGSNVILAAVVAFAGIRACQATFWLASPKATDLA